MINSRKTPNLPENGKTRLFERSSKLADVCKHNYLSNIYIEEGRVYSYGVGEYGSLGHGGVVLEMIPRLITKF